MLVYFPYRNAIETAHFTKSDEEPGCCGELWTLLEGPVCDRFLHVSRTYPIHGLNQQSLS